MLAGVVAVAVDRAAGRVGLDLDLRLAQGVGELALGGGGRRAPAERRRRGAGRAGHGSRGADGAVVERGGAGDRERRESSSSARSSASVSGLNCGWIRTLTTCTRAAAAPRRRRRPATMSSGCRRGRAEPSGVTQCAAVSTWRGETTTAPQICPLSVSLMEASMSAAAKGHWPAAACWPPTTAPAPGTDAPEPQTTQEQSEKGAPRHLHTGTATPTRMGGELRRLSQTRSVSIAELRW